MQPNTAQAEFERFETRYHELGTTLSRCISRISECRGAALASATRDADASVDEFTVLLAAMDRDVLRFPLHSRTKYEPLLRRLKAGFCSQQQDLQRALFAARRLSPDQQRQQLLENSVASQRVGEKVTGILRTTNETEEIGTHVAVRLREQREQLLRARDEVDSVDVMVTKAKSVMSRMGRRVVTDKLIQGLIITLELGIIGIIVYLKWLKH